MASGHGIEVRPSSISSSEVKEPHLKLEQKEKYRIQVYVRVRLV